MGRLFMHVRALRWRLRRTYRQWLAIWAGGAAIGAGVPVGQALTIVPTFVDGGGTTWNDTMKGVINQAISDWSAAITTSQTVNVKLTLSAMGTGSYLGLWSPTASGLTPGTNLYPWSSQVTNKIDFNTSLFTGANYTWWDPTPADNGSDQPFAAWDALSVARHELGHMMGFANGFYFENYGRPQQYDKWGVHISNHVFDSAGLNISMHTDDSHRASTGNNATNDLMAPALVNGMRKRISASDLAQLQLAYGYSMNSAYVWTNWVGTNNWNDDGNWNIPGLPSAGSATASLVQDIAASTTVNLNQAVTLKTLTFGDAGGTIFPYILASGTVGSLAISGTGAAINSSGGNNQITAPVTLGASATITHATPGTRLAFSGGLTNSSSLTLAVAGAGTVSADYVVNAGTLNVSGTMNLVASTPTPASPPTPVAGQLAGDSTGTSIVGTTNVVGNGSLVASRIRQAALSIGDATTTTGASVTIAESYPGTATGTPSGEDAYVSVVKSLGIYNSSGHKGTLDLKNNDIIIDYTGGSSPLAAIEAMVRSGYNGGTWTGAGITSSIAAANSGSYSIVVLDNAARPTPFTAFDGWTVPTSVVIVKFSWVADLDLDGVVTSNDAIVFANNYAEGASATHRVGDLNYNGIFDSNDAILFANAYNESLPHLPEPVSIGALAMGAAALLRRRTSRLSSH